MLSDEREGALLQGMRSVPIPSWSRSRWHCGRRFESAVTRLLGGIRERSCERVLAKLLLHRRLPVPHALLARGGGREGGSAKCDAPARAARCAPPPPLSIRCVFPFPRGRSRASVPRSISSKCRWARRASPLSSPRRRGEKRVGLPRVTIRLPTAQLRGELRVGRGAVALGDFLARLVGHVEEAHLRRERRWRSGGGQVQGRGGGV